MGEAGIAGAFCRDPYAHINKPSSWIFLMNRPPQARSLAMIDKVLDAAEAVLARDGVGRLTMDAVAAEAAVSKGGVLHHFRSKDALVSAVVLRRLTSLKEGVASAQERLAGEPHSVLRGMVDYARGTYADEDNFSRPMLVATVENSESLAVFQDMFAELFRDVRRDTAAPDAATALLFATIGIQVGWTLGFSRLTPGEADAVFRAIGALASALPGPEPESA